MPFACLFVPDFSVQALVRLEQPVAVFAGVPPLRKVFGANAAAKTAGVEIGMTKTQAELCPGIVWRQRSLSQESTAYSALLDCAWIISPRVEGGGREELPDTVVVDIAGCETLLGSPEKIAGHLRRVAAEVGFDANVAVAANAETAICAARGFPGITVIPQARKPHVSASSRSARSRSPWSCWIPWRAGASILARSLRLSPKSPWSSGLDRKAGAGS